MFLRRASSRCSTNSKPMLPGSVPVRRGWVVAASAKGCGSTRRLTRAISRRRNQSFTLTAYVFAIFPQTLPAWGFAIWDATGKLVLTNESRVLSDLQTVGTAGANGGINIDQTLSGSWAVAPAQLGQTIITNNATKPPTIYTINAYSSCRFNGGSTRINAGGTSTGTGSPGGGTNTGMSLTAINTTAYD